MNTTEMAGTNQLDQSAVVAVRGGDAERYRELVERHERRIYAIAWSRLGDVTLAEEATQEAFIRAYRRLRLLRDGTKFSGWIAAIARRVAINFGLRHRRELNKRKRWAFEHADETAPESSTGESDSPCTSETLRQTLAELPASHRECLVLFYLEGKSGAEAAAALGISETALRVRLHRARAALRERLEEKLEGSLANLRPAKTLVPSIMAAVLGSSSTKAAAGGTVVVGVGAKIASVLGKTILFSWFFPLISLIITVPNILVMSVVGRMERKNYRDADGFRSKLHQRFFHSFIWGLPLASILFAAIAQCFWVVWGPNAVQYLCAGLLLALTPVSARYLTICRNQYQVGMFVVVLIYTIGCSILALGLFSPRLAFLPWLTVLLCLLLIFKKRPIRMDYNLFLRAAYGLLQFANATEGEIQSKRFDRRALLAFARFLGSRFLATNFRWETSGLVLRLPPVDNRFWPGIAGLFMPPISRNCSHILLGYDGTVMAHCGNNDWRDLSALKTGTMTDPQRLECLVVKIIGQAWREFRIGNLSAAERLVGDSPESEVFVVPPARAKPMRWWRVWIGASAVLMAAATIIMLLLPKHSHQRLKPVELTEAQVRYALEQKANNSPRDIPYLACVLPSTNLMSAETLEKMRANFLTNPQVGETDSSTRVKFLLDARYLQVAVVTGWFNMKQLGLSEEIVHQTIVNASTEQKQDWFELRHVQAYKGFTALPTDDLAPRLQCLDKLGCLDAMEDKSVAETLLQSQILTDQMPPGRRPIHDVKPLHGLFFTGSSDP
ncbi:MAG TPA: RNA polymerase sigma factor, partial [Verrucomicrobiae bacterium]|nr:RNA polymerase sigma factor [Verrucomicrobiae bacterium]